MYEKQVGEILKNLQDGKINTDGAIKKLKFLPFEDLGFAKIDHHRALRTGVPEAIFCQNKTAGQVAEIIERMDKRGSDILATRASGEMFDKIKKRIKGAKYNKISRTIIIKKSKSSKIGKILVMSAGTADIPVAEEAAVAAETMGNKVERIYDVGVAGLHRLLSSREKMEKANVIVVAAGMDGALPAVVSGLVGKPVIAVPTSVGYGAAFNGLAPLLTMLNACSPGVAVVNIDNGFGAGCFAGMINRRFQ